MEFWGQENIARIDIKPQQSFVVYSGSDQFSLGNDIVVIPPLGLMQKIIEMDSD